MLKRDIENRYDLTKGKQKIILKIGQSQKRV